MGARKIFPVFINDPQKTGHVSQRDRKKAAMVCEKYRFKSNPYYLSLIDPKDPDDPVRNIIYPDEKELISWGKSDASQEKKYTKIPGLQHKYSTTALLLVSNVCGGFCRFCFRKRLFGRGRVEILTREADALSYIRKHSEITNVLLTGGDPLMLPTRKLAGLVRRLRAIRHVGIIRIGTKMPAYYPDRIINDPALIRMIKKYSLPERRIYIMTHFNVAREITQKAIKAVDMLIRAGCIMANQTPLIRGVNDSPYSLAMLFRKLAFIGVPPYYVFQCRPTLANRAFVVPVEEGYDIFEKARSMVSGTAKRARFVMSTSKGKIHIAGMTKKEIILKFYRPAGKKYSGKILMFKRNPQALWLDDYEKSGAGRLVFKGYSLYGQD